MKKTDPNLFELELWEVSKLIPYERNNKKHPLDEIKRLAASIKTLKLNNAIQVDVHGVIIAGHGRRLAVIELGWTHVPVIVRRDLTPEQVTAARISDNITTGLRYDTRALQDDLRALMAIEDLPFTADDIGLSKKEQDLLLAEDINIMDLDAVMADPEEEIRRQKEEDREAIAGADAGEVKITEILGFKTITREDARRLSLKLGEMTVEYGATGRDALFAGLGIA